jgi:hypothetical protein
MHDLETRGLYIPSAGRDSKKAIAGKQATCFVTDPVSSH